MTRLIFVLALLIPVSNAFAQSSEETLYFISVGAYPQQHVAGLASGQSEGRDLSVNTKDPCKPVLSLSLSNPSISALNRLDLSLVDSVKYDAHPLLDGPGDIKGYQLTVSMSGQGSVSCMSSNGQQEQCSGSAMFGPPVVSPKDMPEMMQRLKTAVEYYRANFCKGRAP